MNQVRVHIITPHPAPYRDPLFRLLHERGFDIEVAFYFNSDPGHHEWKWKPLVYPSWTSNRRLSILTYNFPLHLDILSWVIISKYDALVVSGYDKPTSWLAILFAKLRLKKVVMALDTVMNPEQVGALRKAKDLFKNLLIGSCDLYWVPGRASIDYLSSLGIPEERIFCGLYCLDPPSQRQYSDSAALRRRKLRSRLGIADDAIVFLFVGKLTQARRVDLLLDSWSSIGGDVKRYLVVVGDGPCFEILSKRKKNLKLVNVYFFGAVAYARLPEVYQASDIYVHPGTEPYSTALERAALEGLAIVSNHNVGYVSDLLSRGAVPYLFHPGDVVDLTLKIELAISEWPLSEALRGSIRVAAHQRNPDWAVSQFSRMLSRVVR